MSFRSGFRGLNRPRPLTSICFPVQYCVIIDIIRLHTVRATDSVLKEAADRYVENVVAEYEWPLNRT
jgi:hypothetical protein